MKRFYCIVIILCIFLGGIHITAYADTGGDGNIDSGGGGMGQGTNQNKWSSGNEGVRVTVVRANDHAVVTSPIDLTNSPPENSLYHFGKVCKLQYTMGTALSPVKGGYTCIKPPQVIPRVISSNGRNNIEVIKKYFCSEFLVKLVANHTGINYDVLIGGEYRLLLEPIAYYTFRGKLFATTATEAALYDQKLSGGLRKRMVSLTHKNLPLSMFLEIADLGYPAWGGSRSTAASDADIISSLGLGIVRFNEMPPEETEVRTYDYEYRTNTEVITAVTVRGGQSDPDHPVSVIFDTPSGRISVDNVYYPDGESQLAWIRWTTPDTPQVLTIHVQVQGGGTVSKGEILVKIVDLDENPPPDPNADDRNDSFSMPSVPGKEQETTANWNVWRPRWHNEWVWHDDPNDEEDRGYWCDHGWWEFDLDHYSASLTASISIIPDEKSPTASGKTMKSGYGINEKVMTHVSTSQSSAVTAAQNAVTYFPEFGYENYWRLLERMGGGYDIIHEFKENRYSTYNRRTHFVPIWFPDGNYTPYTWLIDCWTPAGMLSMNLTDSVIIRGNLWNDWHIAPQKVN
ncbi:hypothetical protein [Eisenbergiella sp.]